MSSLGLSGPSNILSTPWIKSCKLFTEFSAGSKELTAELVVAIFMLLFSPNLEVWKPMYVSIELKVDVFGLPGLRRW